MQQFTFVETIKSTAKSGCSLIPLKDLQTKQPAVKWTMYQHERADEPTLIRWFSGPAQFPGVAVITGAVSDNLQGLDFDCKNDDGVSHAAWRVEVERRAPGLLDRLVSEQSRSGGRHYFFRCDEIAGGVTLAYTEPQDEYQPKSDKMVKRAKPLIETKENGRYMATYPTPGYTLLSGSLLSVPTLTAAERAVLHSAARLQNKHLTDEKRGGRYTGDTSLPGADYSQKATIADMLKLLLEAGWTEVRRDSDESIWLERPGKSEGSISANLKLIGGAPIFYVYSSSCEPFTEMKGHNAFTVLTFLKYNGSFKNAANALRKAGYGAQDDDEEEEPAPDLWELAEMFYEATGQTWAWDAVAGQWRNWNGQYWTAPYEGSGVPQPLHKFAVQFYRAHSRTRLRVTAQPDGMLTFFKILADRNFTRKTNMLNFTNGTLEIAANGTYAFAPHDPQNNLVDTLGYEFLPDEDFPRIREFLRATMPDEVARNAYAAHLGLALLADRAMHIALVLVGGKNSGKSSAYKLANLIVGNRMVSGPGGQIFSEEQEGLRARAVWNEKLLVAIDELPADALRYENTTKAMLAHSSVPMRHLNQREIKDNDWRPKVLFTCNEEPRFTDRTATVKRRLLFISCPNAREEGDPTINRYLMTELQPELGAFVSTCIEQALEVLATGRYPESADMTKYADRVELESDALKSFIHYHCTFDHDSFTPSTILHGEYGQYCALNGHKGVLAQTGMVRAILQRYERTKGVTAARHRIDGSAHPVRGMKGIRLRVAADEDPEDLYSV